MISTRQESSAVSGRASLKSSNQVLFEGNSSVKKVILNRPLKLNCLNVDMVCQMLINFQAYEKDSAVKLVILKSNGRAFSVGGDIVSFIRIITIGHWSLAATGYSKNLTLEYLFATYKKPLVSFINGSVMGGGAGLAMHTKIRVVTENTVFAMPEASVGNFPDVGASHFLSRLPGFFGEYLGLTGARLNGSEMLACGLATHFVPSKVLILLENALYKGATSKTAEVTKQIDKFKYMAPIKHDSVFNKLETINKCFSKDTVEEILSAIEMEMKDKAEKWMVQAVKFMKSASPTCLKIFLKSIREGRKQTLEQCLVREYTIFSNIIRRTIGDDFYEGARAKLFEKDNEPKWKPQDLQSVNQELVDRYFANIDDPHWANLDLHSRSRSLVSVNSRL